MSTLMKWLIMLLAWFLFSWLTFATCVRDACCIACDTGETTTEEITSPPTETEVARYPVESKLGYSAVTTTDQFTAWKDGILAQMEDGKLLEVEGLYYASETAPEGYDNMGLARADEAIKLLSEFIPADRMRPVARLVGDAPDNADNPISAAATRWRADDSNTNLEEEEVISISEDEKILLFPRASVEEIRNQEVNDYLDNLAEHLKANPNDRVQITGHASKTGASDVNMTLSRRRANRVMAMLTSRGVPEGQIDTAWKGDTQLADPGNTEAAHRRNRRAVIKLMRSGN